jgi:acyl-CoA synthetase (AMP-forming)/AMP-acid ligase II
VVEGVPGAGYVRAGADGRGPIAAELTRIGLRALGPSLVIIQAGHDDIGVPVRTEQQRVRQAIALIRAMAPHARIALITVFTTTTGRRRRRGGGARQNRLARRYGPGVIRTYADGRPAAIDPEGWLDSGDLGRLDEDGYLFLAGRSDDVINRDGEKIYPREIEDVLLGQPGVRSAAVVAARDEVLGQRPVAYIVPAGPWRELEQALRQACEAALPRPKRPSAFCLVRELPVGPTGKVARHRLRELAAAPGAGG